MNLYLIVIAAATLIALGVVAHTIKARRTYNGQAITVRVGLNPDNRKPQQDLEVLAKDIKATQSYGWEWHQ